MRIPMRKRTTTTTTSPLTGRRSGPPKKSGSRASTMADAPPAPPLLLASRSPQRRAILEQLGIPFDVIEPHYDEHAPELADAADVVREHARGKAHSVAAGAGDRPVLGVDTEVVLQG